MRAALALQHTRGVCAWTVVALAVLGIAGTASASAPTAVWGVESGTQKSFTAAELARLKARGVNAVVLAGTAGFADRATAVRRVGLVVVHPRTVGLSAASTCAAERSGPARTCSLVAGSAKAAVALAKENVADYVVFRTGSLGQLRYVQGVRSTTHIVAVVPMPARALDKPSWTTAVKSASADPTLDLAVTVQPTAPAPLSTYLDLVSANASTKTVAGTTTKKPKPTKPSDGTSTPPSSGGTGGTSGTGGSGSGGTTGGGGTTADTQAPTVPTGLAKGAATETSVTLAWQPSTDNVALAGYGLYRNGSTVGTTTGLTYTFTGLACGTSYSFGIDAVDAAGNRSATASLTASTSACPPPPPPPPPPSDTTAPSTPGSARITSTTTTSLRLAWDASTDNVGVTAYGTYRNGTSVAAPAGTSYTFSGLTCGTSYTLAVDAVDAAGNRSAKASVTASTSVCPSSDTLAPTTPGTPIVTAATVNTLAIGWAASIDDTAVTGYGMYRDGLSVGTSAGTSFTYTGLACGTTYTLAVDAFDAAGNRSGKASVAASTSACPPPPPPSNGTANLWVDTNGGSCTRQATAGAYADAQACATLNAAYQAAGAGDVILVRGGTYSSQTISDRTNLALGSAAITMHPAPGETVTMNSLQIYAHDFVLDGGDAVGVNETDRFVLRGERPPDEEALGMRDNQGSQDGQHRNLIVEDVHTRNVKTSSDYSTLRYSEIGPSDMGTGNVCSDLVQTADEPTKGWVVEYNTVHDNRSTGCGDAHIDAFDLYVTNGVIRGNRVWWCGTQCLFTGDPSSMLVENNMIEETSACGSGCAGPQELALMGTFTVRYNTIEGDDGYGKDDPNDPRPGQGTVYGNVFLGPGQYTCRDTGSGIIKVTRSNNVYPTGSDACGTSPKNCVPRLANGSLYTDVDRQADYHLAATDTCALGAGKAGDYAPLDTDEQARPLGGAVDAGADER
jgi:chitodextrinase/uncharacterized membrane protein YgcG